MFNRFATIIGADASALLQESTIRQTLAGNTAAVWVFLECLGFDSHNSTKKAQTVRILQGLAEYEDRADARKVGVRLFAAAAVAMLEGQGRALCDSFSTDYDAAMAAIKAERKAKSEAKAQAKQENVGKGAAKVKAETRAAVDMSTTAPIVDVQEAVQDAEDVAMDAPMVDPIEEALAALETAAWSNALTAEQVLRLHEVMRQVPSVAQAEDAIALRTLPALV
jgi:hypothetical protein